MGDFFGYIFVGLQVYVTVWCAILTFTKIAIVRTRPWLTGITWLCMFSFMMYYLVLTPKCTDPSRVGCPFPASFNHNAVMHVILEVVLIVAAVGWLPIIDSTGDSDAANGRDNIAMEED